MSVTKENQNKVIQVSDAFWKKYIDVVQDNMLPFQWDVLHDRANITIESEREDPNIPTQKSHVIENFLIAAGKKEGQHYGWLFQDSDLYKWIEAAAKCYQLNPTESLLQMMNEAVKIIEDAQEDDGYLSTFYQIEAPQLKFRRLFESHELYCAGHLIEAAIAFEKATSSKKLLEVVDKLIGCIERAFGSEKGQINGADGHQEIELALVHLYEHTAKQKYLALSKYFLQVRGQDPEFYSKQLQENKNLVLDERPIPFINTVYHQAHKPVIEQTEAEGHAVRLVYMAEAMASTGHYLKDNELVDAAKRIWENITQKRMYITGGIGSTVRGEAFTYDYDLPTDLMYCETCASIGLVNFAYALQKIENKIEYADVMERVIYNGMISGMSLDGKQFFYVNPLEVDPEASLKNPDKSHVKAARPSWFGCACCPPNLARTIPRIHDYIYQLDEQLNQIWINQWIDSSYSLKNQLQIEQGHDIKEGVSQFRARNQSVNVQKLSIRIPYWVDEVKAWINGEEIMVDVQEGYFSVDITNEEIEIRFSYSTPILSWQSHSKVKSSYGKVAFQQGPFIYAAEEADNGKNLHLLRVGNEPQKIGFIDEKLGSVAGIMVLSEKEKIKADENLPLYQLYQKPALKKVAVRLIPYYLWANRGVGEMRVWLDTE